jgi:hypothetical protein
MPKIKGTETIEELAKYADAITVACYEVLGYEKEALSVSPINTTGFGNMAFIALHHPDERVRQIHRTLVDFSMRTYMSH